MYAVDKQGLQIQAKILISFVVRAREMSLLSESNPLLSSLWIFILGFVIFYCCIFLFAHPNDVMAITVFKGRHPRQYVSYI